MNILMLNANRAGVGTYHRALNFGRELARRGMSVTLMTVSNTRRFRPEIRHESPSFRIIECPNFLDELLPWHASGPIDIYLRLRELWSGNYDVVYAFEYQPNISFPVLTARAFKRFLLLSDWCDWHAGASYHFGGYKLAHAIDREFEEFIRHRADLVTTINRTLYDRARSIGIAPQKLAIVKEGVDPSYIAPSDRDVARERLGLPSSPLVVTIRDSDTATEMLCRALARCSIPEASLVVIGSAPERVELFARQEGVESRVRATGRISDEDLPVYLAAADLLALPLENNLINRGRWPHKLGDMLAAQRPVVISEAGEFPELVRERRAGILVSFSAAGFAKAFDDVLSNPSDYSAMAARGRALIEDELNWSLIGDELEALVRAAATRFGGG